MKLLVTVLVAATALVGCRHHRDGAKTANEPMTPPAYDADAGSASEYAPIPRYQAPSQGVPVPAPSVTAQPGDTQL